VTHQSTLHYQAKKTTFFLSTTYITKKILEKKRNTLEKKKKVGKKRKGAIPLSFSFSFFPSIPFSPFFSFC
jgi:hypothetical protein